MQILLTTWHNQSPHDETLTHRAQDCHSVCCCLFYNTNIDLFPGWMEREERGRRKEDETWKWRRKEGGNKLRYITIVCYTLYIIIFVSPLFPLLFSSRLSNPIESNDWQREETRREETREEEDEKRKKREKDKDNIWINYMINYLLQHLIVLFDSCMHYDTLSSLCPISPLSICSEYTL